ncbi:tumor necrosis factor receptor superfamily member 14-like isoform X7 [Thunnus albacares]|uniref:tumor necrosis factor receptor superfamily member 14-like isoform X7 n=1 Tax=Thunnus albacares TaxID=8236 RepID=UPI001CF667E1|nr:tumor necrosis factor receptor superfamily member 14-like isoform X7 [Thunnus albacares]
MAQDYMKQGGNMSSSLLFLIIILKVFSGHSLTCGPAEYLTAGECCPRCLAGSRVETDCTEFRSTSCLSCTDGTYMNHPTGLKYCLTCGNCDAGSGLQIKTSCTSTSNTVCQPLEGFYCMDSTEDGCVKALKHTSCQPGQYIRQKGTSSTDTVCYNCQPGYFSQDGVNCTAWTICSETEVMVKEGNQINDVVCRSASRNHYSLFSPLLMVFSLTLAWLVSRVDGEILPSKATSSLPLAPRRKTSFMRDCG